MQLGQLWRPDKHHTCSLLHAYYLCLHLCVAGCLYVWVQSSKQHAIADEELGLVLANPGDVHTIRPELCKTQADGQSVYRRGVHVIDLRVQVMREQLAEVFGIVRRLGDCSILVQMRWRSL